MSVEAICWALNLAPVPADRGGQPLARRFVLVGLATHAGPDGTAAFPSVATLVRYTGLSGGGRSAPAWTSWRRGDHPALRSGRRRLRIKRAYRRPKGWDPDLTLIRDDLTEADNATLGHQFPGLCPRVSAARDGDESGQD